MGKYCLIFFSYSILVTKHQNHHEYRYKHHYRYIYLVYDDGVLVSMGQSVLVPNAFDLTPVVCTQKIHPCQNLGVCSE